MIISNLQSKIHKYFQFLSNILGYPKLFMKKLFKEQRTQADEGLNIKIINHKFAALKEKFSDRRKFFQIMNKKYSSMFQVLKQYQILATWIILIFKILHL